jgi:hypothetical protein
MKRAILISAAVLLALSACGKKTDTAATGTATPTSASTSASASAPPSLLNPPPRKPGLWVQTVSSDRMKSGGQAMKQSIKMCLDATTEQKMKWWGSNAGPGKRDCQQQAIKPHLGGGWDFHSVCNMGESGTVTSDGAMRGDFGSHYTVELTSNTTGSPMPQANGAHKMTIEATWTGPCPADMKPGDMEMPGGLKVNLTDRANGQPGHLTGADIAKMRARAEAMAKAHAEQH